jgi:hypothetical protein
LSLVLFATGWLIPYADGHHRLSLFIGTFLAVAVCVALFAVPIRYLPAITLLVTLLIPTENPWLPPLLRGAAFGVVPLAVWIIRAPKSTQTPSGLRILACLLGVWLVLSEVFAPLHTNRGSEWLLTVGIALVFAVISTPMGFRARDFRALFLAVATVLGVYALLEGVVLHRNVLFAVIFEHSTWWQTQQLYNVSYRVTTLLGHPLFNGLVFCSAAVLAASDFVERSDKPLLAFVRLMILVGATDATHSRSAAIALGIGIIVVVAFSNGRGRGVNTRRLVLATSLVLGAVITAHGLQARDESREGQASAQTRIAVIDRASETLAHVEPFGAGPGESEAYRKMLRMPGWEVALENSYAQLAVSLGPIGALLMVALLIAVVVIGYHNELVIGEATALLAILIDMAGFNAIEDHRPLLILLALFVIVILTAARSPAAVARDRLSANNRLARRLEFATTYVRFHETRPAD